MKKLAFLLVGTAALALGACGSKDLTRSTSRSTEHRSGVLNEQAANAADLEMNALGNQQAALQRRDADAAAPTGDDNLTSPSKVEDDVQGM